jgi:opacity protein-like surface antigen
MKTIKYPIFTIFTVLLFSTSISYSQLHISLGPAIGYTIPQSDFAGSTADYYNGTKYGLTGGIDFGAIGRLGLGPFNFNLSLMYAPLSNSGSVPDPNSGSTVDIKMHILTVGVGTQYGFGVPLAPVKPYIGLDLLFSSFGGSFQFHGTQRVNSSTNDMNSSTRVGLGISAGVNLKLLTTSIDVSLRYNMLNLFSKRFEAPDGERINSYLYLNDDKDPNYPTSDSKHPIGSSRTIATLQLQLGVMFGF